MDTASEDQPKVTPEDVGHFRVTSRTFESYQRIFSLDIKALNRKATILDIGSGERQEFSRGLRGKKPHITVVSVDPTLAFPVKEEGLQALGVTYGIYDAQNRDISTVEERAKRIRTALPDTVAALAPNLPFVNNSFDAVFDNHSAFMYLPDEAGLHQEYISQLLRILKPSGIAYVYPLDLYSESLLDNEAKLEISRQRIEQINQNLDIKRYELFTYDDRISPDKPPHIRLGIKITKE